MTAKVDAALIKTLKQYDTPTLANAVETFDIRRRDEGYTRQGLRCMFPELGAVVGVAATATISASGEITSDPDIDKFADLYEHVSAQPAPTFVVVHDRDQPEQVGSMWGEVNAAVFQALGCVGSITDGTVRDLTEVRATGFQFFAAGAGVSHGYVRLETVGEPVTICGLRVEPGDLLHGDQHGVLSIPKEIAHEIPAAADRVLAREQRFIRWIRSDEFDPDQLSATRMQH